MKMCCAGTEQKEQSEVKRRWERKSMYVCLGGREWDSRWEKEKEDEGSGETWWVMWEQVWERANKKKMKEQQKRGDSVGRWQAQTEPRYIFKHKGSGLKLFVCQCLLNWPLVLPYCLLTCLIQSDNAFIRKNNFRMRQWRNQTQVTLSEEFEFSSWLCYN